MACVDDRDCNEKGPCESFPCKNNGKCTENGALFKCECVGDFQGETCNEPKPRPCDSSPCKNNGICSNEGASFSCQCRNNFIGRTCEKKPPNPCIPNPCLNRGVCHVIGNGYSCKCPVLFGGTNCEDEQSSCRAVGDPHYTTFDNRRIDFQGKCEYIFAEDCGPAKSFRVWTKNLACGRSAACVSFVRIQIDGVEIKLTRELGTAIVNGAKIKNFPLKRKGFVITNPSVRWLHVTTDIGVTVRWDCRHSVTVVIPSKYRGKTCGLCGNNNGNPADDTINAKDYPCVPPVGSCVAANSDAAKIVAKCELMKKPPFSTCNAKVNPNDFIADCKFDACRCKDPMLCVCDSFAAYSQICSRNSIVLDWRFVGNTVASLPLPQCVQQCKIPGQIFTECGSSCAQSCRDLSRVTKCNEQCVPGCQCPPGSVLSDHGKCISISECSCEFEGKTLQPGESTEVGNCKTCTCDMGAVKCVKDRSCSNEGPCDSFPCQNDGICSVKGNSFSCNCPSEYQGATCEERKPTPCDSQPCQNDGVCTVKDGSFTCECPDGFIGTTCADAECMDTKLDILYIVDGSGSVRETNFEKIKAGLKEMNQKFAIGPDKVRIALMQFGRATQTKIEFNFDEKTSLAAVNQGVDDMKWLASLKTATGDALKRAREGIFNGKNGDRSDAPDVLILFTDGIATDTALVDQFEEAKKLKDAGVKIITVAMGGQDFIDKYRENLRRLASVDESTDQVLQFEADFENLNKITSKLVQGAC
ncbi:von Willebrand factor-like [Dendronephthya gigantea]|uniref:von Willebrand factor-like n=1 Tax=Dendronephthya gigantea TaxID=151771 RepID=UPI00106900DA|nr:von Willebrand factor-like [Dendronephthya gigantea]